LVAAREHAGEEGGLAVVGADGDVDRLVVVGKPRLGAFGGRGAFGGLALHEFADDGRLRPHGLVEAPVDEDRRGGGHGLRVHHGAPFTAGLARRRRQRRRGAEQARHA
jgi:hypothetical protein